LTVRLDEVVEDVRDVHVVTVDDAPWSGASVGTSRPFHSLINLTFVQP